MKKKEYRHKIVKLPKVGSEFDCSLETVVTGIPLYWACKN